MAELVSKAYAEALFSVATEDDSMAALRDELNFVVSSFEMYPAFFEIMKMPTINKADKQSVVTETFEGKLSVEMMNFLKMLIAKNRIADIFEIGSTFNAMVDDFNKVLSISVESVMPLTAQQLQILTQKLKDKTGKQVILNPVVNPDLLGGIVVKMGEQIIDGSVKYKLEGMLEGLTQIIV
ncbi:ATP synthase F1 subunit delta [Fusibacter paucivorans]|uniref:ATP synthase subunit delta n=1 Tax=Fusibacter paucivorans TaxID=76009 RepID=A0ABS5PP39_9FIRM|nr:ATP synthase F1 subunit delta [Fusibacter paucivorans]MBS7525812.1 ATP synthase F1 subunit delta [Fusibacter paucivorans]